MTELEQEQPKILEDEKRQVSYENAVHPVHAKKAHKEKPLIDLGNDIAQKSINFVEKFFSDSSASNSESEGSSNTQQRRVKKQHHHHDYVPDDPSSLSQELPIPAHLNERPLPARPEQHPQDTEDARKEFDEHLSTIVSMFPNVEPGVCFMILQANEGRLPETIER
jgi:hypothetical protein